MAKIDRELAIALIDERIDKFNKTHSADTVMAQVIGEFYTMGLRHAQDYLRLKILEVDDD